MTWPLRGLPGQDRRHRAAGAVTGDPSAFVAKRPGAGLAKTAGLRAGEVAALTLDDIDWKRERLAVPARRAGHLTILAQTPGNNVVAHRSTTAEKYPAL